MLHLSWIRKGGDFVFQQRSITHLCSLSDSSLSFFLPLLLRQGLGAGGMAQQARTHQSQFCAKTPLCNHYPASFFLGRAYQGSPEAPMVWGKLSSNGFPHSCLLYDASPTIPQLQFPSLVGRTLGWSLEPSTP